MTDARRTGIVYRLRRYIFDTRQDDPRVNATKANVGSAVWNGRRSAAGPGAIVAAAPFRIAWWTNMCNSSLNSSIVDRYLTRSDGLVTENANAAYHLTALHQYLTSARENAICSTR